QAQWPVGVTLFGFFAAIGVFSTGVHLGGQAHPRSHGLFSFLRWARCLPGGVLGRGADGTEPEETQAPRGKRFVAPRCGLAGACLVTEQMPPTKDVLVALARSLGIHCV